MNEIAKAAQDIELEEISKAVNGAFDNFTCLRCGHDQFAASVTNCVRFPAEKMAERSRVELVCTNCGKIEAFDIEWLKMLAFRKTNQID